MKVLQCKTGGGFVVGGGGGGGGGGRGGRGGDVGEVCCQPMS